MKSITHLTKAEIDKIKEMAILDLSKCTLKSKCVQTEYVPEAESVIQNQGGPTENFIEFSSVKQKANFEKEQAYFEKFFQRSMKMLNEIE